MVTPFTFHTPTYSRLLVIGSGFNGFESTADIFLFPPLKIPTYFLRSS